MTYCKVFSWHRKPKASLWIAFLAGAGATALVLLTIAVTFIAYVKFVHPV